jgi:hypothetical protein
MYLSIITLAGLMLTAVASPASAPALDPARQVVFDVKGLECCLVNGVGCGHLLAPQLAALDRVPGVQKSFSNWTGTKLRIVVAPSADANAVADRVRDLLAESSHDATRLLGNDLAEALRIEQWYGAERAVELTAYEYHTFARRQLGAFAKDQKLDDALRQKLLALLDDLWDRAADGLAKPSADGDAYQSYWRDRRSRLIALFTERAKELLTPQQIDELIKKYASAGD